LIAVVAAANQLLFLPTLHCCSHCVPVTHHAAVRYSQMYLCKHKLQSNATLANTRAAALLVALLVLRDLAF
jgi:hypothetical protein